jgi:hypothetical protein
LYSPAGQHFFYCGEYEYVVLEIAREQWEIDSATKKVG